MTDRRKLKVLVCEDNAMIAMELETLLEDIGCVVVGTAARSDDAFAVAARKDPALALVDLGLADGWTGPLLIERLGQAAIPSIVISGQTENYEAGEHVLAVLPKPVDGAKLKRMIEDFRRDAPDG